MHPAVGQSLLLPRRLPLKRFVVASLVLHAALAGAALVWSTLVDRPRLDLDPQPIKASLVRLGKPRDERLLPRKEEAPPPPQEVKAPPAPVPPAPTPPPTPAAKAPGVGPPAKPVTPQPGVPDSAERRKRLFGAFDRTAKQASTEELEGAEDGDPEGDSAIQEGERYFGLLSAQVRRYYDVSSTISEAERMHLRASVVLRLGRSGDVLESRLGRSSGNALFDSAVLAAVRRASPFSPPPEHLRDTLQRVGVQLEFRP